ncbi:MAG: DNA internalization-related competence protein ComEC/Rec2 [Myxococcales bacterium]|nr:DNA internalization-related competence protein ComEC/Rec2 [Myxococcales bacterium]USN51361.1 MAG: DNA internalization-related competence protein ComEC/Rec2 [Myxococcales bacterium]
MQKRPLIFLCLATFIGSFLGIQFNFSLLHLLIALLLLFSFICFFKNHGRIVSLLFFIVAITTFNATAQKNTYKLKVQTLLKTKEYSGSISDIRSMSGTQKKLLVQSGNTTIELKLYDAASALPLQAGQYIKFNGQLKSFDPPLSEILFDSYSYGLSHNIHARASIKDPHHILWQQGPKNFISSIRNRLRHSINAHLVPHQSSLLLALILGETDLFSPEQKEIYQKIGAQHLLAVSGLQVSMLAGIIFFTLSPFFSLILRPQKSLIALKLSALLSVFLLWFFVALCHFPPSAIRAGLMASIALFPALIGFKVDLLDSLLASCFLCLLFDPLSLKDLGFLLSYAATLGLICTHHFGKDWIHFLKSRSYILTILFGWAISSMGAFLATLPITCLFFASWAPSGALANLFLVPIASILQIPAIIFGLIGALTDWTWLLSLAGFCANLIEIFTDFLSSQIGNVFFLPHFSFGALICCTIGSFILFLSLLKKHSLLITLSSSSIILAFISLIFSKEQGLKVTIIPVGQGDASLIQTPSGKNILVDAGGNPFSNYDPGKNIVVPTLKHLGVKKLDALVITHPDPDHILGAFAVLDSFEIKEIWHSGYKPGHHLHERLTKKAFEKSVPIKTTEQILGTHNFGHSTLRVLAPFTNSQDPYFKDLKANDNSLVLLIEYGGKNLLLPGDIEKKGEQLLLSQYKDLHADIVKAPHHGSRTSSTKAFVKKMNPQYVIYSTGKNNRFSFPHQEVVERYQQQGAISFDTAIDGQIKILISNNQIDIAGFTSPCKKKAGKILHEEFVEKNWFSSHISHQVCAKT